MRLGRRLGGILCERLERILERLGGALGRRLGRALGRFSDHQNMHPVLTFNLSDRFFHRFLHPNFDRPESFKNHGFFKQSPFEVFF